MNVKVRNNTICSIKFKVRGNFIKLKFTVSVNLQVKVVLSKFI